MKTSLAAAALLLIAATPTAFGAPEDCTPEAIQSDPAPCLSTVPPPPDPTPVVEEAMGIVGDAVTTAGEAVDGAVETATDAVDGVVATASEAAAGAEAKATALATELQTRVTTIATNAPITAANLAGLAERSALAAAGNALLLVDGVRAKEPGELAAAASSRACISPLRAAGGLVPAQAAADAVGPAAGPTAWTYANNTAYDMRHLDSWCRERTAEVSDAVSP